MIRHGISTTPRVLSAISQADFGQFDNLAPAAQVPDNGRGKHGRRPQVLRYMRKTRKKTTDSGFGCAVPRDTLLTVGNEILFSTMSLTTAHILLHCPKFNVQRTKLMESIRQLELEPSTKNILTNRLLTLATQEYLAQIP